MDGVNITYWKKYRPIIVLWPSLSSEKSSFPLLIYSIRCSLRHPDDLCCLEDCLPLQHLLTLLFGDSKLCWTMVEQSLTFLANWLVALSLVDLAKDAQTHFFKSCQHCYHPPHFGLTVRIRMIVHNGFPIFPAQVVWFCPFAAESSDWLRPEWHSVGHFSRLIWSDSVLRRSCFSSWLFVEGPVWL